MTRKSSPSVATTSSVGTTFGWWMRAARRASSRNIETNSGILARTADVRRLIATVRAKPPGRAGARGGPRHPAGGDELVELVSTDDERRLFGRGRATTHERRVARAKARVFSSDRGVVAFRRGWKPAISSPARKRAAAAQSQTPTCSTRSSASAEWAPCTPRRIERHHVAVKMLHRGLRSTGRSARVPARGLHRERRITPGVVRISTTTCATAHVFLVMELLEGKALDARCARPAALPGDECCRSPSVSSRRLAAAHDAGRHPSRRQARERVPHDERA